MNPLRARLVLCPSCIPGPSTQPRGQVFVNEPNRVASLLPFADPKPACLKLSGRGAGVAACTTAGCSEAPPSLLGPGLRVGTRRCLLAVGSLRSPLGPQVSAVTGEKVHAFLKHVASGLPSNVFFLDKVTKVIYNLLIFHFLKKKAKGED